MSASAQSLRPSRTGLIIRLWQSSLGKKYVMAITGLGLFLFVIVHMLGNLQIYLGEDAINAYAHALKSMPVVLWGARIGLLTIVALHITAALQLASQNRKARPISYNDNKVLASSVANRTILFSGLIILAFIIFHLAHYTLGIVDPEIMTYIDNYGRPDVYRMMILGFSNPFVSLFYIVSMGLLLFHLSHGVSSLFQSLGLRSKKTVNVMDKFAKGSALVIFLGNCSIPLSILAGILK